MIRRKEKPAPAPKPETYAFDVETLLDVRALVFARFAPDGCSPWFMAPEVVL